MAFVLRAASARRITGVVVIVALSVLAAALPTSAAPDAAVASAEVCTTTADAADAAVELYGAGTELVAEDTVAGLSSALVLEPRIHPGTRRRMLAADGGWCDAAAGFNRAWTSATGGRASAAAAAEAFASVAATPYFDGVTVRSVQHTAGAHIVTTHATTNGVEARWVIAADAQGVSRATWTATAFARKPFTAQLEGLTAFPGAAETYSRLANGVLVEQRGLPTAERAARQAQAADPQAPHEYVGPDGMRVRLSIGDSHGGIDPDTATGVNQADTLTNFADAIATNYQEFHDWGLRKGWVDDLDPVLGGDLGWVYVNDALSLYCLACVFIADDFQIHMISEVVAALGALGFDGYKDEVQALSLVVGHEMFHNFQNAYNKPGPLGRSAGRGVSTAYSEGTARMQESLHSYSDVTFADKTLVTGGQTNPPLLNLDGNHCNGFGTSEAAFADGPFTKTYNACYFWFAWYNQNGMDGLVRLVAEGYPAHATESSQTEGVLAIADAAPTVTVADQLAHFADASLTGQHRTVTSMHTDEERDWGSFFFRLEPPVLAPGDEAGRAIGPGGVFARKLEGPAHVTLTGEGLALYEIRFDGVASSVTALPAFDAEVAAPAFGESVWVVAVNPTTERADGALMAH